MTILFSVFSLMFSLGSTLAHPAAPAARWPLEPQPHVVARFDPPSSAYAAGHRGVDLAGSPDQPVLAPLGGTIRFAGNLAGRGVVVIDDGSRRTTYEPVLAAVHVGESVTAGQVIGSLQTAQSHCFPRNCLHWGLVEDGDYRDPLELLGGGGPVRLLPLEFPELLRQHISAHSMIMPSDGPAGTHCAAARS